MFDYDMISANDLIGTTKIDLETRWLSSKRGNAGHARSYVPRGVNRWRDALKPSEILADWCSKHGFPPPTCARSLVAVCAHRLTCFPGTPWATTTPR